MATGIVPFQNFAVYSVDSNEEDQDRLSFSGIVLLSNTQPSTLIDLSADNRFGDRRFTPRRIWIDNSTSGVAVSFLVQGTGQVITVKANTQGVYPLFAQDSESGANFKITVSGTPAGLVTIPIQIFNFRVDLFSWVTA
jgi:hypothetical protein